MVLMPVKVSLRQSLGDFVPRQRIRTLPPPAGNTVRQYAHHLCSRNAADSLNDTLDYHGNG